MAGWTDKRPLSPHLQIWKWHPAMASSILHRAAYVICYIGLFKVAIGLLILLLHGTLPLEGLIFSPLGAIGLFVFFWAFLFMAFAQIRHLIWDRGNMFDPKFNNTLSIVMILASIVLAAILTFFATGAA